MEQVETVTVQEWAEQVAAGELLTAQEVAQLMGVVKQTVYDMRRRGDLPAVQHPTRRQHDAVRYRRSHIMKDQPAPAA